MEILMDFFCRLHTTTRNTLYAEGEKRSGNKFSQECLQAGESLFFSFLFQVDGFFSIFRFFCLIDSSEH